MFADGGGLREPSGELQSAAVGKDLGKRAVAATERKKSETF